jgi:serine/threonine-protein kinase PknG
VTTCNRPGCTGRIMATGFCGTCGHRDTSPPREPEQETPRGPSRTPAGKRREPQTPPAVHAVAGTGGLDQHGLVVLPDVPVPDLDEVLGEEHLPPTGGRPCGFNGCTMPVGVGYGGQQPRLTGRCPRCGTPYSFLPELKPGHMVDHYRILGSLPGGGLSWVYLAADTQAQGMHVVLKGLLNVHDAPARRKAVEEQRSLTELHHPDIVRLITYTEHQVPDRPRNGYLVMDYIAGRSLRRLFDSADLTHIFKGRPRLDHVLTYGCKILGALQYMHERGLLHCDVKPSNVIHFGREIKVVDLGAVRAIGDRHSKPVYTDVYAPPFAEIKKRGWHVDTDLYTVGRTLDELAQSAEPAPGLAADSFRLIIERATHTEPRARFHSAAEMSRQLWEALREFRSLQFGEQLPESSTRFSLTDAVLDAGLGAIPSLGHWTDRTGGGPPRELSFSAPPAAEVAGALPQPVPDPGDGAALLLDTFPPDAPDRVAEQWRRESRLGTVETALWLCRAYLRAGRQDKAEKWLAEAETQLGGQDARYDWRISWHRGVLHLSGSNVDGADKCFDAVFQALPGEYVPKLALGYCAERHAETRAARGEELNRDSRTARAMRFYEAVWKRDFGHAPAAFGLARGHLASGRRDEAVRVLDDVPSTSRHYDTARIAAVRIRTGTLRGRPPSVADLKDAARRLPLLRLDGGESDGASRARLVAEVRESVLGCWPEQGWGPDFPAGTLFGSGTENALRELLEQSFRRLAGQAHTADEHGRLLDLANTVRPMTNF